MPTRSFAALLFAGFLAGAPIPSGRKMPLVVAAASLGFSALFFVPIGFAFDRFARMRARAA